MAEKILIAADDRDFFSQVHKELQGADFQAEELNLSKGSPVELPLVDSAVVLLSAELQAYDSCQIITYFRQQRPDWAVIVIARKADKNHAIKAISSGAADYLVQPLSAGLLLRKVHELFEPVGREQLIAHAPATRHAAQLARRAAVTEASILITGESGTGKEVFSRYIHQCSTRKQSPFVSVNCAAIPETMLESTLFGHEKGAFTGAAGRRLGKFELANNGTLFLDEVAEMPMEQQAKLLRVLQEQEVERLGGTEVISVNVRIISATNRDLRKMVEEGLFREDLYYRLNVFPLHLAPLRERKEDVLPLTHKIMKSLATDCKQPQAELSAEAAQLLQRYDWPGNVRELENVIQRACVLKRGWVIMASDLMLPEQEIEKTAPCG